MPRAVHSDARRATRDVLRSGQSIDERLPARAALLARTAPAAPRLIVAGSAQATSDEQRSRERCFVPLARRVCHEQRNQESRSARLAWRHSRLQLSVNPRYSTQRYGGTIGQRRATSSAE